MIIRIVSYTATPLQLALIGNIVEKWLQEFGSSTNPSPVCHVQHVPDTFQYHNTWTIVKWVYKTGWRGKKQNCSIEILTPDAERSKFGQVFDKQIAVTKLS